MFLPSSQAEEKIRLHWWIISSHFETPFLERPPKHVANHGKYGSGMYCQTDGDRLSACDLKIMMIFFFFFLDSWVQEARHVMAIM